MLIHAKHISIRLSRDNCINAGYSFLLYLLIFDIMISHFFPESFWPNLSPYVVFLSELSVMILISLSVGWRVKLGGEGIAATIILIFCLLFTGLHAGLTSMIFALAKEFTLLFMCVFFVHYPCDEEAVEKMRKRLIVFALVAVGYSLIHDHLFSVILTMSNAYAYEIGSFWNRKNAYGRFLYLASVLAFSGYVLAKNEHKSGIKQLIVTGIFSIAVVFTFARTPLLSLGVFFMVYLLLTNRAYKGRNFCIVLLGLCVLIYAFSNPTTASYLERFILRKEVGLAGRELVWRIGMQYIQAHPFVGAGEYMAESVIQAGGVDLSEFHNIYIYRMFASGVVVSLLYVYLWGKLLYRLWCQRKENVLADCSIALAISLLVYMLFEQYSFYRLTLDGFICAAFFYFIPNMTGKDIVVKRTEAKEKRIARKHTNKGGKNGIKAAAAHRT